jgi:hypothetical protein
MIRRVLLSVAAGLLGMAFVLAADDPPADQPEPPIRLKKKAPAPDAGEKPPEEKGKMEDEPPGSAEPEMNEQEILNRVSRNMRTSEERLANKELGEGTRQLQRDILEDLDKLINKLNQPPDNSANQGGGQPDMPKQGQQGGQQQMKSAGRRSSQRQQAARGSQKQGGQQARSGQNQGTQQAKTSGQDGGNNPGAGGLSPEGPNRVAEMYKDVWGHLPETLRQEMTAYSRQEYMMKYSDAIKQYYSAVAEKGRQKGD